MSLKIWRNASAMVLCAAISVGLAASGEAAARRVALVDAVKNGDAATVRSLVAENVDVNAAETDGTTALHWAAHLNDLVSADLLINAGADIHAATRNGATPFGLACYKGNADVIKRLLVAGADANAVVTGEPVLMMVARAGNPDAVRALLAGGANANVTEATRGQTALMWAASEGNTGAMRVLIEGGANVTARSVGPGKVPQMGGRIPRINDPLGLRSHRDPTWAPNNEGLQFTPVMWAARDGQIEAVTLLLDAGANVNDEKPGDGTTVLILAIINRHYELASYLLDRGADPNLGPGFTALHQVAWTRRLNAKFGPLNPEPTGTLDSLKLAEKILAEGVEINAQMTRSFGDGYRNRMNRVGATAFMLSGKLADLPMMRLLKANGADHTITNADGDTPLMLAAGVATLNPKEDAGTEEEVLASVKYLLEELEIDVNAVNNNGETALFGPSYRGFNSVAQYLVDQGAELQVENLLGWSPVTLADGVFFAGFFKAQPHTAVLLREFYAKQGLPVPEMPKVNDTSLLSLGEKFAIGDVVRPEGKSFVRAPDAEQEAGLVGLLLVTLVDAQGQIMETELFAKQ